jgi:hypothetical protein
MDYGSWMGIQNSHNNELTVSATFIPLKRLTLPFGASQK